MLYGVAVNVPSTCVFALNATRLMTPLLFDADAASVGLVPRLYVVLVDGVVSWAVIGFGVGVGVGAGVEANELFPARSHEAAPP